MIINPCSPQGDSQSKIEKVKEDLISMEAITLKEIKRLKKLIKIKTKRKNQLKAKVRRLKRLTGISLTLMSSSQITQEEFLLLTFIIMNTKRDKFELIGEGELQSSGISLDSALKTFTSLAEKNFIEGKYLPLVEPITIVFYQVKISKYLEDLSVCKQGGCCEI